MIWVVLLDLRRGFGSFGEVGEMILVMLLDLGCDLDGFAGFGGTTPSRNQLSK